METYRFSEDLDFTVLQDGPLKPEETKPLVDKMLERVHDESGIKLFNAAINVQTKGFSVLYRRTDILSGAKENAIPGKHKIRSSFI